MGANVKAPKADTEHEVWSARGRYGSTVEHLTAAERAARGKGARADVPRSSHA